jgi:hypothetical protein
MHMSGLYAKASSQLQMLRLAQIVIQLRKFAEAVKRIKGAVSPADKAASSAPKGGRPAGSGGGGGRAFPPGGSGVLDRDMSGTLRTEMSGIDPSLGGARPPAAAFPLPVLLERLVHLCRCLRCACCAMPYCFGSCLRRKQVMGC